MSKGLGGTQEGSNKTNYLRVINGAIWQTVGNIDPNNPLYVEEPWETKTSSGVRKGYRAGSVSGRVESIWFKEIKYPDGGSDDVMDTYIRVDDELYSLQLKLSGSWGTYSVAKRMMTALLFDEVKTDDITIHVMGQESGKYTNNVLWVSHGGKNFVLNPRTDEVNEEKQIPMPDHIRELIENDVETVSYEEIKDMSDSKKERTRRDELYVLEELVNEMVANELNAKVKEQQEADKASKPEPKEEIKEEKANDIPDDVKEDTKLPKKDKTTKSYKKETEGETVKEKIARLKAEREAKNKK